jgi:sensor histidine kinase regulating citrate/malate metabolism
VCLETASDEQYGATITISDDGPGIPDYEVAPLQQEQEDSLMHGSCVGLWLIKWGIERLGGQVEFAENESRGSTVRLHVPDRA